MSEDLMKGEEGYSMATLETAMNYVIGLTWSELNDAYLTFDDGEETNHGTNSYEQYLGTSTMSRGTSPIMHLQSSTPPVRTSSPVIHEQYFDQYEFAPNQPYAQDGGQWNRTLNNRQPSPEAVTPVYDEEHFSLDDNDLDDIL